MDGLTTILPEIQSVVSSENRRHADPWLQQILWVEQERTLVFYILSPARESVAHTVAIQSCSTAVHLLAQGFETNHFTGTPAAALIDSRGEDHRNTRGRLPASASCSCAVPEQGKDI